MPLVYKFRKFKLEDGDYVKRPIVNIVLKKSNKFLRFDAILDSGSDITTISQEMADYLEIKSEDIESEMIGYRGKGKIKHGKLTLIFKGKVERQDEILNDLPVGIMQDPDEQEVVVGTKGVFEHFKILFNDSKSISLTRLSNTN